MGSLPVSAVFPAPAPRIRVSGLVKRFRRADGSTVRALDEVSFEVAAGEFLVLLGPSGCGKTTLLRSMAGLENPDAGRIEINGSVVFDAERRLLVPPERRTVSMMFQQYALWPTMTVFDNVAYPLRARRGRQGARDKTAVAERVHEMLRLVRCEALAGQHPGAMSGGQQQRVALARALAADDPVVFFDEPLSNVDAKVREELRLELAELQARLGFSAVYVTHDQIEALALAHRVAVLDTGRLVQIDPPRDTYLRPRTAYVARFVGTVNEFPGTLATDRRTVATAEGDAVTAEAVDLPEGSRVRALGRPEAFELAVAEPGEPGWWHGELRGSTFLGPHHDNRIRLAGGTEIGVWTRRAVSAEVGDPVWVRIDPADLGVVADDAAGEQEVA